MVSTCPLISKFWSPLTNHLGIVPSAPITIGITVTLTFHIFFSSQARSTIWLVLFFLLTRSGRRAEMRWSVGISKPRGFCASYYPGRIPGCAYTTYSYGIFTDFLFSKYFPLHVTQLNFTFFYWNKKIKICFLLWT